MAFITFRVIDGPDRGKVFGDLTAPVTIGREDGNTIELNDERVSRFHLKVFDESGKAVLADLGSTNGTQVNGEPVHLWVLRPGDLVTVGKSLMLYGTKAEIARRLRDIRSTSVPKDGSVMGLIPEESDTLDILGARRLTESADSVENTSNMILEQEIFSDLRPSDLELLRSLFPPQLPEHLTVDQNRWLMELFIYLTLRLRAIAAGVETSESEDDNVKELFSGTKDKDKTDRKKEKTSHGSSEKIALSSRKWQNLLDLYALVAGYQAALQDR